MSYEGFEQHFCENGHLYVTDDSFGEKAPDCTYCGAKSSIVNRVDDTNCDEYGFIPFSLLKSLIIKNEVACRCPCGHSHEIRAIYRIPSQKEIESLRCYREDGKYIRICVLNEAISMLSNII